MPSSAPSGFVPAELFENFDPADWPIVAEGNQGRIVRVQSGGLDLAVKTPRGRGLAWRARQFSLRREYRAYRRIEGLPGFPRCFGLFRGCHLTLEYIDGALLRHAEPADPERFFEQLRETVEAMHDRGVAHGDLKSRKNVMIAGDGRPVILDLGTSLVLKPGWRPFNRWLFNYLRQIDRN
ncbi:MAG TPA: hypothetical protein VK972_02000, partial [Wenzhouxiangella sp.]|nr:hypothetical protein [Wenzhouxiangella sp.]